MLAGTVVHSSAVATAVMIGLGGLTAVTALWSLLAGDPTRDYLALAVVGFALFLAPWVGGFASGGAAWTAWTSGCVGMVLGVAGYLRGESLDISRTVADAADATVETRSHRSGTLSRRTVQYVERAWTSRAACGRAAPAAGAVPLRRRRRAAIKGSRL
ncbi:SPW repeat domain-containing protein [Nocardia sp. Marseille-Q1738]